MTWKREILGHTRSLREVDALVYPSHSSEEQMRFLYVHIDGYPACLATSPVNP